jgi:hypothetical protein
MTSVLPPTISHFPPYLFISSCMTGSHSSSHQPTPSALLRLRRPIQLHHPFALQISPNAASGCPMSLSMTRGSLTIPSTTHNVDGGQSLVNSSTHHHCLMRWILLSSVLKRSPPMVNSFERISTCCILNPMYVIKSMPSSRNIGLSSMTKAFSSPSRTTNVSSIPGSHSLLPSRKHPRAKGDNHHAGCHCCPGKSRPHTADP